MLQGTGQVFIVAAPSGGGKTSLVQHLVTTFDQVEVSISHTTRDRRPGEEEAEHYFFVSEPTFLSMIQAGSFIEHAKVYGHHYGTSVLQIESRLSRGIDVVLDIDWQGAQQIRKRFPEAISIFILPPSFEVLRQRLVDRQRDCLDTVQKRMEKAKSEIQHYDEFDYLIINDDFSRSSDTICSIVTAERSKMATQARRHQALLSFLMTDH
ncbi:MAG: guanylate kinase [Gammaproteobacteria bacterium]|nr:guanylate kinase [Gammaproteobacteria bacterium]